MMNWILLVMAGIMAVVLAVLVGGLMMPATYSVRREIVLRSGSERVEQCLQQVLTWPVWMERALNVTRDSHVSATGVNLSVLGDDTAIIARLELAVHRLPVGTRVTCVEAGRIGNPITRFVRQYTTGGTARNADAVLTALAEQLDEFDVRPAAMT